MHLNEYQTRIHEIGQRVKPFQNTFKFNTTVNGYRCEFTDPSGNKITVDFYLLYVKTREYEIDFMVNGSSYGDESRLSLKQFFLIISTVIECVNKFISEFEPYRLRIDALEKSDDDENHQKHKIWKEYVLQNIMDTEFVVAPHEKKWIILQNNHKF